MKLALSIAVLLTGTAAALHRDLDQATKREFAQKRKALMEQRLKKAQDELTTITNTIASLKKGRSDLSQLSLLSNQYTQLNTEITHLSDEIKIIQNSVKALTAQ